MSAEKQEEALAEIKILVQRLEQRFDEILAELRRVERAQERLASKDRRGPTGKREDGGPKKRRGTPPGKARAKSRKPRATGQS